MENENKKKNDIEKFLQEIEEVTQEHIDFLMDIQKLEYDLLSSKIDKYIKQDEIRIELTKHINAHTIAVSNLSWVLGMKVVVKHIRN